MTQTMPLNDGWEFRKQPSPGFFTGEAAAEPVRLPHTGTLLPYNYSDENTYQYISGYRRRLTLPPLYGGRRLFVRFEGAAQQSRLVFNGVTLLTHACGYTAFTAELTAAAKEGENLLALELDAREELDIPPFGNEIDYLTYQGVYRGCSLILTGPSFLSDVFVHTRGSTVHADIAAVGFAAAAELKVTDAEGKIAASETVRLSEAAASAIPLPAGLPVKAEECSCHSLRLDCPGVRFWSTEAPVLYTLTVTLRSERGETLDEKTVRFGFREAEFRADGFYLNGERITLRGLDRHQSFPYVGYAMPDSVQKRDAEILHDELGLNIVRTSHYPQSQAFLDRCDELGLLVFTEIPGWQHIGGRVWKAQAVRNVDDMVAQDRNHPSVILWGVRINESMDDDELYRQTNERAHLLDPSRQTGGVRYIRKSHLLEDVYTFNDFRHSGRNAGLSDKAEVTDGAKVPYLVTEYNGHMFPTKSSDDEPHRLEHAMRHARVLDAMYGSEGLAGCIGWCAFDYNTHRQFGSGDRICYHGVMDMFRNPKPAAAVYASQSERRPVLEVCSTLDKGDWPASVLDTVWAFTNGDSVRVWRDGVFLREFLPDRETFPNLPHPPVRMNDFSGPELAEREKLAPEAAGLLHELWSLQARERDGSAVLRALKRRFGVTAERAEQLRGRYAALQNGPCYRFEAVRNGKVTAQVSRAPVAAAALLAETDRTVLTERGMWDAVEVRMTAVDQNGGRLWYAAEPLLLRTEGPLEIIGPRVTVLRGGAAGVWLRTTGEKGAAALHISGFGAERRIEFTVE